MLNKKARDTILNAVKKWAEMQSREDLSESDKELFTQVVVRLYKQVSTLFSNINDGPIGFAFIHATAQGQFKYVRDFDSRDVKKFLRRLINEANKELAQANRLDSKNELDNQQKLLLLELDKKERPADTDDILVNFVKNKNNTTETFDKYLFIEWLKKLVEAGRCNLDDKALSKIQKEVNPPKEYTDNYKFIEKNLAYFTNENIASYTRADIAPFYRIKTFKAIFNDESNQDEVVEGLKALFAKEAPFAKMTLEALDLLDLAAEPAKVRADLANLLKIESRSTLKSIIDFCPNPIHRGEFMREILGKVDELNQAKTESGAQDIIETVARKYNRAFFVNAMINELRGYASLKKYTTESTKTASKKIEAVDDMKKILEAWFAGGVIEEEFSQERIDACKELFNSKCQANFIKYFEKYPFEESNRSTEKFVQTSISTAFFPSLVEKSPKDKAWSFFMHIIDKSVPNVKQSEGLFSKK